MALCLLALMPLARAVLESADFFTTSDGFFHILRAMQMGTCLQDSVFPCRWAPEFLFGYGYPLFNFYSPLLYYWMAGLHQLGAGWFGAARATITLGFFLAALGMYLYTRGFMPPWPAALAAALFTFAPYNLANAYYRADLPEFMATAVFPWVLLGFRRLMANPKKASPIDLVLAGLPYAALMLLHNLSAFLFSFLLAGYCLVHLAWPQVPGRWRLASRVLSAGAVGMALSAFYWVPALAEKHLVQVDNLLTYVKIADHFPPLSELFSFSPAHQYALVFPDMPGSTYQVGLAQAVAGALGLVGLVVGWRRLEAAARREAAFAFLAAGACLFMLRPASQPVWQNVPFLGLAQFPWRLLAELALPLAVLAAGGIAALARDRMDLIMAALALLTGLSATAALSPPLSGYRETDLDVSTSHEFELVYHIPGTSIAWDFAPHWVRLRPRVSPESLQRVLDTPFPVYHPPGTDPWITVQRLEKRTNEQTYLVEASQQGQVTFNLLYYPGWRAWVDAGEVEIRVVVPEGLATVDVPPGQHIVRFRLDPTPVQAASEALSALAVAGLLAVFIASVLKASKTPMQQVWLQVKAASAVVALVVGVGALAAWPTPQSPTRGLLHVEFDGGRAVLLGYSLNDGAGWTRSAGQVLPIRVDWRSGGTPAVSPVPYARLTNLDGQQWTSARPETPPSRTTDGWSSVLFLPLPAGLAPGVYTVEVGFSDTDGRRLVPELWRRMELAPLQPRVLIGPVRVAPFSASDPASDQSPVAAFRRGPRLLKFGLASLSDPLRPQTTVSLRPGPDGSLAIGAGETLSIDLLWQVEDQIRDRLEVAAKLVDDRGFVWAVRQSEPVDGMYPVWLWPRGAEVRDQLRLRIPQETPPGRYRLTLEVLGSHPLDLLGADGSPAGTTFTVAELAISRPASVPRLAPFPPGHLLADGVRASVERMDATEVRPGDEVRISLLWQAGQALSENIEATLALVDDSGRIWGAWRGSPVGDHYPTTQWRPGEVLRGYYSIRLAPGTPPGTLSLRAALSSRGGAISDAVSLANLTVVERPRRWESPAVRSSRADRFGDVAQLVGFDLDHPADGPGIVGRARAGPPLQVRLVWRSLSATEVSYKVTTQLLDAQGRLVAQHDSPPDAGRTPTTLWAPGEYIEDLHPVPTADLAPGQYSLVLAVYDPVSGQRLLTESGLDHVALGWVMIEAPSGT